MKRAYLICLLVFIFSKKISAQITADSVHYFKQLFPESGLFLRPESLPDGKWIAYCAENPTQIGLIIHYKNGKRNGECLIYWPNGILKTKFFYLNGSGSGKSESWYKNGQKESESGPAGQSKWNYWAEDGTQLIKGGSGYFIEYHPNGALQVKGKILNGLREGEWKWYRDSGKPLYTENFANGKHEGPYVFYLDDGSLRTSGQYKDDKMTGVWKEWNSNGKQAQIEIRNNGYRDGECTYWYENGNMQCKGAYKMGKEEGKWTYWKENGKLDKVVNYKDGVILK